MEFVFGIMLVVLAVIAFAVWAFVRVVGWALRALSGSPRQPQGGRSAPVGVLECRQAGCRAANPAHGRFCRRCGRGLGAAVSARSGTARMRYVA